MLLLTVESAEIFKEPVWSLMEETFAAVAGLVLEDSGMTHPDDEGKTWEVDHHFDELTYWYASIFAKCMVATRFPVSVWVQLGACCCIERIDQTTQLTSGRMCSLWTGTSPTTTRMRMRTSQPHCRNGHNSHTQYVQSAAVFDFSHASIACHPVVLSFRLMGCDAPFASCFSASSMKTTTKRVESDRFHLASFDRFHLASSHESPLQNGSMKLLSFHPFF